MAKRRRSHRKPGPRKWKASRILTWVGVGCLVAAVLVLGFFAFSGGEDKPRAPVRQEPVVSEEPRVAVEVVDNDFIPKHLTVRLGTEVVWEFTGDAAHDVTEDRGAFASGIMQRGDEYSLTFEQAGTFYYYCTLHHSMQGTLVVEP